MKIKLKVKDDSWYTDNPRVKDPSDLFYSGCGCTWDTDLDGKRYWLRWNPILYPTEQKQGIVDEKARIEKIIRDYINSIEFELKYRK